MWVNSLTAGIIAVSPALLGPGAAPLAGCGPKREAVRGYNGRLAAEVESACVNADRVIVGMSGGVDSSVAALLLRREGREVSGLFMKNWDEDDGSEFCTAQADYEDAARVCDRLGIELHSANFAAEYWDEVFTAFLDECRAGRTPNPDVLCNREIKFKQFSRYAEALGAERTATGHYARLRRTASGLQLLKGRDPAKDQTYFLQALSARQLAAALFPVGELTKAEVRRIARRNGLHNHDKKDSTGICFIGERRFRDFLQRYLPRNPGAITDPMGTVLGEHVGLAYYTRGQRQGLAIGGLAGRPEAPWYVLDKDPERNRLIITQDTTALMNDWLLAGNLNWLGAAPELPRRCTAKIRHGQPDQGVWVQPQDSGVGVAFEAPQRAIAPGQYVCFYDGEVCLGGGVIERFGNSPAANRPSNRTLRENGTFG